IPFNHKSLLLYFQIFNMINLMLSPSMGSNTYSVAFIYCINSFQINTESTNFFRNDLALFKVMYSRKVFVGGLPSDITEPDIRATFEMYGDLIVDWPKRYNDTRS